MCFSDILKRLPDNPGVYMMYDKQGSIIYVGKAKSLKKRVSQYFADQKDREPKIAEMISNIHRLEWLETDTELDALIEECRLIKEIRPRYNRQMKFNHSYVYIKVTAEQYPRLTMVNKETDDGAEYFGPFATPRLVDLAVRYLNDFYLMRKCSDPALVKRNDGCLHWKLGTCLGVCISEEGYKEYMTRVNRLNVLMSGYEGWVVKELKERLSNAIESLEFEQAAKYHEYYQGLRHVIGKQRLAKASSRSRNIIAAELVDDQHLKLFLIKGNKLLHRELFSATAIHSAGFHNCFVERVRDEFTGVKEKPDPPEYDINEAQIIYTYLRRNRSRVLCFWIPSTRLSGDDISLEDTSLRIVERLRNHMPVCE